MLLLQVSVPFEVFYMIMNQLRGGMLLVGSVRPKVIEPRERWPLAPLVDPSSKSVADHAHIGAAEPKQLPSDLGVSLRCGTDVVTQLPCSAPVGECVGRLIADGSLSLPDGTSDVEKCAVLLVSPAEDPQMRYAAWAASCREGEGDSIGFLRAADPVGVQPGVDEPEQRCWNSDGFFGRGASPSYAERRWWEVSAEGPLPWEHVVLTAAPCPPRWFRLLIPRSQWSRTLAECRVPDGVQIQLVNEARATHRGEIRISDGGTFTAVYNLGLDEATIGLLYMKYALSTNAPYPHYIYFTKARAASSHFGSSPIFNRGLRGQTLADLGFTTFPVVFTAHPNLKGDIGVLGRHPDAVGVEFLRNDAHSVATPADAARIRSCLGATSTSYASLPDARLLSPTAMRALRARVDRDYHGEMDLKVYLSVPELETMVGVPAVADAVRQFGARVDDVVIRRVAPGTGEVITFHTDHALKTMQIALNDDADYVGGRLVFVTDNGLVQPPKPAGSVTVHDCRIAHGVTALITGVRYGLFFLTQR
jgi:hypothetical protein